MRACVRVLLFRSGSLTVFFFFSLATAFDDRIRLTPQRQGQRGALWNVFENTYTAFEASFQFEVTGKADMGADGLG